MFRDRLNRDTSSCDSIVRAGKGIVQCPAPNLRKQLSNNLAKDFVGRKLLRTNNQIFLSYKK
jgi:hypothetical protein